MRSRYTYGNSSNISVEAPVAMELTSINIDSAAGIFTGDAASHSTVASGFDSSYGSVALSAVYQCSFLTVRYPRTLRSFTEGK